VMLTHSNLVENARQFLAPGEIATDRSDDIVMCFLPLYHIYGLNVVLNPTLMIGGTLVLMPRFDVETSARVVSEEGITWLNLVPPAMNALANAAADGRFPRTGEHRVRGCKSGAAPLAADLPRRFTELTGIRVRQGYGMTEASPVTHIGYLEPELYRPDSIGTAVAATECKLLREDGSECSIGEPGELVMRGPQFMRGYWNDQEATGSVLRDGWYYSGDIAVADERGLFQIVDRRKELIKYKGFPIAPAEVEAVLMEHPAVRDCGVVGCPDGDCGEIPIAFVVPRDEVGNGLDRELPAYVAERLIGYKQPRQVRIVQAIPRNPSGKILRKDLRAQL
jgi:long-chain acyl-CoA synthetase